MNKIKQLFKYLIYALYTNIIFFIILFSVYAFLIQFSPLYVYLGNIGLICIGLYTDDKMHPYLKKTMESDEKAEKYMKSPLYTFYLESFISFKTVLYLFYIIILIVSEVLNYNPHLLPEWISGFIMTNRYSILILLAFDRFTSQFSSDRKKIKDLSKELDQIRLNRKNQSSEE